MQRAKFPGVWEQIEDGREGQMTAGFPPPLSCSEPELRLRLGLFCFKGLWPRRPNLEDLAPGRISVSEAASLGRSACIMDADRFAASLMPVLSSLLSCGIKSHLRNSNGTDRARHLNRPRQTVVGLTGPELLV